MTNVLFIVPYDELFPLFYSEVNKINIDNNISITFKHIYGTDTDTLLSINADVIVSRGITAIAVAKYHPNSLVIQIPMSPNDFTEALYSACKKLNSKKIGLLAGSKTICNPKHISKMVNRDVEMYVANTQEEVRTGIDSLIKIGCDIFVGGLTMCRICEDMGYPYVHISSGEDAINRVIRDALAAAKSLEQAKIRVGLLSSLLSNNKDIIVALNSKGEVIVSNEKADEFFQTKLENLLFENICNIKEIFNAISTGITSEFVREYNKQLFFITVNPMEKSDNKMGYIVRFHKVEDILNEESKVRKELTRKGLIAKYTFNEFLTTDEKMLLTLQKAKRYSLVDGSIILLGETGTGKELIAQSIHNASPRKYKPFVAVNCATLTAQLLDSELFGYERGSFTGAKKEGKIGLFELAHGGSIFLDEIGELPITLQAKLLRVLQEKEIRRIGGDEVIPVDVRVISATNLSIYEKVKSGSFRLDLFYRLGLFSIKTIPLKNRVGDINLIFNNMYEFSCKKYNKKVSKISDDAIALLESYQWPGNVRELKNSAERLAILNNSDVITKKQIELFEIIEPFFLIETENFSHHKSLTNQELYQEYINSNLSKSDFAKQVGMSRSTLWRKISEFEN
ncbi:MAG: sigma 54-interacting transcriptional regulator [Spirochaetales bacterium]|nr:sigma 54-interacting transcriptional regulator [Spirochaetales bacterium]